MSTNSDVVCISITSVTSKQSKYRGQDYNHELWKITHYHDSMYCWMSKVIPNTIRI